MATWPSTLPPRPLATGYQIAPEDQTVRTDMEAGLARVRRRTRARNDRITAELVFSAEQFAAFRAWFDADTGAAGGAAWFTGLELSLGDRNAIEARFTKAWQSTPAGPGLWRVSAEFEAP